jgi:hypothetical protein
MAKSINAPRDAQYLLNQIEVQLGNATRKPPLRLKRWPPPVRKAAEAEHLGWNPETYDSGLGRQELLKWLLVNGASPKTVVRWIFSRKCVYTDTIPEFKFELERFAGLKHPRYAFAFSEARQCKVKVCFASEKARDEAKSSAARLNEFARDYDLPTKSGIANANTPPSPSVAAYYRHEIFKESLHLITGILNRHEHSPVQLREISVNRNRLRSRPILDVDAVRRELVQRGGGAGGVHIGPAYDAATQAPRKGEGGAPLGTELVLEIDDIPPLVPEELRWAWMRFAVVLASHCLHIEFGVEEVLVFCSGNRGVHIWSLDDAILKQTLQDRKALVWKMTNPRELQCWPNGLMQGFVKACVFHEAGVFKNVVDSLNAAEEAEDSPISRLKCSLERLLDAEDEDVLRKLFPSFDQAVALQPTHLHRMPMSVHEKTGRIAMVLTAVEEMPPGMDALPSASDVNLGARLAPALDALRACPCARADRVRKARDVIPEVKDAAWVLGAAQKKRKRVASTISEGMHLRDFEVRVDDGRAIIASLERAAHAETVAAIGEDWARAMATKAMATRAGATAASSAGVKIVSRARVGDDIWRGRLRDEAKKVRKVVDCASAHGGKLRGQAVRDDEGGRTRTYYPDLQEYQTLCTLAKATRAALNPEYVEVDFGAAHQAAAWGAVVGRHGEQRAKELCPRLHLAATDKDAARKIVASELGKTGASGVSKAKTLICAALNQESNRASPFLRDLCSERACIAEALASHRKVAAACSITPDRVAADPPPKRELSILLQTMEDLMLSEAATSLTNDGFRVVLLINDGLLVEPPRHSNDTAASLRSAETRIHEKLGVAVRMEKV